MSVVTDHRASCDRQRAQALGRLSTSTRADHRREHAAAALMLSYGCQGYNRTTLALLGKDGSTLDSKVDRAPRAHRIHLLRPGCENPESAVDMLCHPTNRMLRDRCHYSDADWKERTETLYRLRIDRQIEGCKRALWLYVLWMGMDPSGLRATWYHAEEFMSVERWTGLGRPRDSHTDYWRWAWKLMNDGRTVERLQGYLAALVERRATLSTARGETSGAAFLVAFGELMDRLDGVAA